MNRNRPMPARLLAAAIVVGSALVAVPSIATAPAWAATSPNLVKNSNAEKAAGGTGEVVPVPGWTETVGSSFTAVKYGSGGSFPSTTAPGPNDRGSNFFAGGPAQESIVASQTAKLAPYAAAIKGGHVTFKFQAYLGGTGAQNDQAGMEIDFKDKNGFLISSVTLPAVTATDRGNVTGLLHRVVKGAVPKGAKTVLVQLSLVYTEGNYNDAYADNISLTLKGV